MSERTIEVGQTFLSARRHMDDDGRLYEVVAIDGQDITIDDAFAIASNGEVRQRGARRRVTTAARLMNRRHWWRAP